MNKCKECGSPTDKDYCEWCESSEFKCNMCGKEFGTILIKKGKAYFCPACENDYSPIMQYNVQRR